MIQPFAKDLPQSIGDSDARAVTIVASEAPEPSEIEPRQAEDLDPHGLLLQ